MAVAGEAARLGDVSALPAAFRSRTHADAVLQFMKVGTYCVFVFKCHESNSANFTAKDWDALRAIEQKQLAQRMLVSVAQGKEQLKQELSANERKTQVFQSPLLVRVIN